MCSCSMLELVFTHLNQDSFVNIKLDVEYYSFDLNYSTRVGDLV